MHKHYRRGGELSQLALYRKYRSKGFDEVVGQQHVVSTLISAIKKGRVSHAYLFTGPRGVGKTSVARILARAINCVGEDRPCQECEQCLAQPGTHLDIIEIDAASNRGIDEARDLRDKIHLAPSMGKYKIYIIDEVHMLTKESFNALLKTLEEPPAHAVFILATTESHKLPETVISRTQRFNFRPLSAAEIANHLKHVAKTEKISVDGAAVKLLADAGHGSLRDSISLLDQIASLEGKSIDAQSVRSLLGWSDSESIDELIKSVATGQTAAALNTLDRVVSQGSPPGQIITQLSERLRELLLQAAGVQINADDKVSAEILQSWNVTQIAEFIDSLITASKSSRPALALEATLARFAARGSAAAYQPAPVAQAAPEPAPQPSSRAERGDPETKKAIASPPTSRNDEPKGTPAAKGSIVPEKALEIIKQYNHSLYALVRACDMQIIEDTVVINCRFSFHYDRLREAKNLALIEQSLSKTSGGKVKVNIQLQSAPQAKESSSELISSALDILGGELINE